MCVYTTTTFVFFFLGRKPRMIQWIICKLCETPPVLPPLSSFIILMISRTKCEIMKNSKKISFLCKKVSSKNVDIDSNFIVFDANSALFSQIELILQILYEISRILWSLQHCNYSIFGLRETTFHRFVPIVQAPLSISYSQEISSYTYKFQGLC